jgi:hypothetical protein
MMLLIRGRVVYFGPNDRSAIDYVSGLPMSGDMTPYKPGMNDAVGGPALSRRFDRGLTAAVFAAFCWPLRPAASRDGSCAPPTR